MMLDRDVVAASPSSVWRVLGQAGLLQRWNPKPSLKGTGFQQPLRPHQHWHIDVSYINIAGTFYYLCSVLDGASRYIVHWEIRESMKEPEVEVILQRAREQFPDAMHSESTLLELIGLIYDAAGDASRWAVFLERFGSIMKANATFL